MGWSAVADGGVVRKGVGVLVDGGGLDGLCLAGEAVWVLSHLMQYSKFIKAGIRVLCFPLS